MKANAYGKFIALNTYIRNFTKRLTIHVPRSQEKSCGKQLLRHWTTATKDDQWGRRASWPYTCPAFWGKRWRTLQEQGLRQARAVLLSWGDKDCGWVRLRCLEFSGPSISEEEGIWRKKFQKSTHQSFSVHCWALSLIPKTSTRLGNITFHPAILDHPHWELQTFTGGPRKVTP